MTFRPNSLKANGKLATPWGVEGSTTELPPQREAHKPVRAAWINGSSVLREEEERKKNMPVHKTKSPWEPEPEDEENDFDRRIAAENFQYPPAPWQKAPDSSTNPTDPAPNKAAINYKYQPLHEPIPLSEARKKQMAEYEMDPPFMTDNTGPCSRIEKGRPHNVAPRPPTLAPWMYGDLERPDTGCGKKMDSRAKDTSLWALPAEDKAAKMKQQMESSGDPILDKLRQKLHDMGADGIFGLSRKFRVMDDDGSGALDFLEFTKAMNECRLDFTKPQIKHLFLYFDKDDSGTISYDEFVVGIRGVLNKRRRAIVQLAFNVLDRDGSGVIEMTDIADVYDASRHPDVVARRKTSEDVLKEFIANMEVGCGQSDGLVTLEEFLNYYASVSASIDDDDYFELMIRNAWHISGGEGWCANTTNRRVLVTHADGRQTVEEIKNDIGIKEGDKEAMAKNLQAQGIKAGKIETSHGENPGKRKDNNFKTSTPPVAAGSGSNSARSNGERPPPSVNLAAHAAYGRGSAGSSRGGSAYGSRRPSNH